MKIIALICVMAVTVSAIQPAVETSTFEEARPVGTFFLFSTSFGRYAIRYDSMGEITFGVKRRAFWLKRGMAGRIERMSFSEYQGDLLVVYRVNDGTSYVGRMNQQSRKMRWLTPIKGIDLGPCAVEGSEVQCGSADSLTKVDLNTGARL